MHLNTFQRQFSLPCLSVEILEPHLGDGYAKGNVHCGGGLWDLKLQL